MAITVPQPREPVEQSDPVRQWYANELGWATAERRPGLPVQLLTGLRFDVLQLPAEAGFAALRHVGPKAPVALRGDSMRLFVAAGSAEELPGLLEWLEWGDIALDLTAIGADGLIDAPTPPGWSGTQGAAVWLRPPEPGCEVEPTLPALPSLSCVGGGAVSHSDPAVGSGLVRLVDTAATHCHRVRLRRTRRQPLAFS
ncbi:SCO3374 family protein [Streptomyces sp. NPDC055239]